MNTLNKLDRYFQLSHRNSTFKTEVIAGLSTFFSLAYILVVNPAILSQAGVDPSAALFATAIASGLATILMGVWARLPFALAPGLEMNGFVVFSAVGVLGLSWQQALGAVFWSGILCILMTWLPIRSRIISAIPGELQANLAISVGVFVATIGLHLSKILIFDGGIPSGVGSLLSVEACALYVGLIICIYLRTTTNRMGKLFSSAAFLIATLASTLLCIYSGITAETPAKFGPEMFSAVGALDLLPFTSVKVFTVFLVLFLIDFYGSIGKFIGLTAATNLRSADKGVIGLEKAMYVDGLGTVGGSVLGTTSIITYVESAIGIHAGGRTGIVAVICGALMLLSLAFTPLISAVPVVATSGILVYVGYALLPREEWRKGSFGRFDVIVGLLMAILSFATFSLDKAMLLGFGAYLVKQRLLQRNRLNPYLLGSFVLLLLSITLQLFLR